MIFELISLFNQMRRHGEQFARYMGVNFAQFTFMTIIAEVPDVTVGHIAQRMNVTSPFVTAEIGKLVEMGIVFKQENRADRRSSFLKLTERGENLMRELAPILRRGNDQHFRSLTEESARALTAMIHALVEDGRRVTHELESPDMRNAMAPSAVSKSAAVGAYRSTRKRVTPR